MKVHKHPLKSRPIVSVSGLLLENLGVWVDCKLQPFLSLFDRYFKSSKILQKELVNLEIPDGAQMFTANAVSMYTNIPTDRALASITRFLQQCKRRLDFDIPYSALIEGLGIIMGRCAFSFGDTHWEQLTGTAMGTPPAPSYATIYFSIWEQKSIKQHKASLFLYCCFIDNVLGIWQPTFSVEDDENNDMEEDERWNKFCNDLDGDEGLTWEVSAHSDRVDFMDLSIHLKDNQIATSLFKKVINKHLYIPSHSSHPPGVITGVVHSMIRRIFLLCSEESNRVKKVRAFVNHLQARGYARELIIPPGMDAVAKAKQIATGSANEPTPAPDPETKRTFLHLPYHPDSPSSRLVQRA